MIRKIVDIAALNLRAVHTLCAVLAYGRLPSHQAGCIGCGRTERHEPKTPRSIRSPERLSNGLIRASMVLAEWRDRQHWRAEAKGSPLCCECWALYLAFRLPYLAWLADDLIEEEVLLVWLMEQVYITLAWAGYNNYRLDRYTTAFAHSRLARLSYRDEGLRELTALILLPSGYAVLKLQTRAGPHVPQGGAEAAEWGNCFP
jgi:hypothetical protein